jgi:hypothetical protein
MRRFDKWFAAFVGLALAVAAGSEPAGAVVCARGVYHAGCAGPRGAVGVHGAVVRPYGAGLRPYPVARPGVGCVWRAGVRICR